MDTKDGQRFIIKIIKSEADLPKKEGFYIMQYKNKSIGFMNWWEQDWRDWLKNIDWYLQPIEEQESITDEEKTKEFLKGYRKGLREGFKNGLQIDKSGL